jgi:glycosyltransferase involved in cell wall biosynthesis
MAIPVLHVCDKFGVKGSSIHGVSRLFSWWFPRYDRSRFEVRLCGLKAPEPASRLLEEQGIPVTHLGRNRFDPRIATDLASLARKTGARILHVHGYASADFGRLVARGVGASLVLHEHFADPRMPAYQGLADRLLAGRTQRAIAVSGSTVEFLVQKRHVPRSKVRLIWNGAPLEEFRSAQPGGAEAVRRELGIPGEAPVVGAVARLSLQKGHRFLLDATPAIRARFPEARILVCGDGDQEGPLRDQAARLGVADRVVFAGHRQDVPAVLAAMDVLAIPSVYEGTPLSLFEAMAAGKAIVSTSVDGCREVLERTGAGRLVPKEDAGALAEGILALLADPAERTRLGERARAASADYDIGACVRGMESLYEEVLAEGPS